MKKLTVISLAAIMVLIISGLTSSAEEWSMYGPRAEGMGGAGVAVADGATAHYWNPGATSKNDKSGLYIPFGLTTAAEGDIIGALDKVAQLGSTINWSTMATKIDSGGLTPAEAGKLLNFFSLSAAELNKKGQGFLVNSTAGLSFAVGSFTVFGNNFMNMNLDPQGDDTHLLLNTGASAITDTVGSTVLGSPLNAALASNIAGQSWWIANSGGGATTTVQANNFVYLAEWQGADTSDPAVQQALLLMAQNLAGGDPSLSVNNNETGVIINGFILNEIGFSYSKEFLDIIGQTLSVGANLKIMEGQSYYKEIKYSDLEGTGDLMNNVSDKENTKSSTTFGIDVGALVSFSEMFQGGLVIRNLNSPKFAYAGKGDVVLDPQTRAGVAMNLGMITLAADYDVTKNKSSLLKGYESQMFAMGAEVNLIGALKLRMGTVQNMASSNSASALTYGLGLNLILLDLDLAGTMANDKIQVEKDGTEIPVRAGFSGALSFRF